MIFCSHDRLSVIWCYRVLLTILSQGITRLACKNVRYRYSSARYWYSCNNVESKRKILGDSNSCQAVSLTTSGSCNYNFSPLALLPVLEILHHRWTLDGSWILVLRVLHLMSIVRLLLSTFRYTISSSPICPANSFTYKNWFIRQGASKMQLSESQRNTSSKALKFTLTVVGAGRSGCSFFLSTSGFGISIWSFRNENHIR